MDWGKKCLADSNTGKAQPVLFDQPNNTGSIDMKMDGSVLEEKSSFKILSPKVSLYLYKSIIRPCMEYCCHIRAGAPKCYLRLVDKLQKRIRRTFGPLIAASLEPLPHCRNVASLSYFYRYYFGRCSSELA